MKNLVTMSPSSMCPNTKVFHIMATPLAVTDQEFEKVGLHADTLVLVDF